MARYTVITRAARSFLRTRRGKLLTTTVLRRAADVADGATGSRYTSGIERARSAAERGLHRI